MKKIYLILLLALGLLVVDCKNTNPIQENNSDTAKLEDTEKEIQEEILVGTISRTELEKKPYGDWFLETYKDYNIDSTQVKNLDSLLSGVKIKTFMGTWCSDSQREVPAFYKIMDQANANFDKLTLIAVTRDKDTPQGLEDGLNITNVPTFIFTKDDKELGRIVEYPIESLEKDEDFTGTTL